MSALGLLIVASAAFVGSHFLLSHPLRTGLIARLGERGFLLLYSLVAIATLLAMVRTYGPAVEQAPQPKWVAGEAWWIVATLLMWAGSILFAGSLRRNPAFPTGHHAPYASIGDAQGVFAITRHPMNWSFVIWAVVHAIVNATSASLVVSAAIIFLAIGGSIGQDFKKRRLFGNVWREWQSRTAFLPFGKGFALPDSFAVLVGTIFFLVVTAAHGWLGHPAGIFHWFA